MWCGGAGALELAHNGESGLQVTLSHHYGQLCVGRNDLNDVDAAQGEGTNEGEDRVGGVKVLCREAKGEAREVVLDEARFIAFEDL